MIKCFIHKLVTSYSAIVHLSHECTIYRSLCYCINCIKTFRNPASINLLLMTFMYIIIVWNVPNSRTLLLNLEGYLLFISAALAKLDWSKIHIIPLNFNDSFIFNVLFITSMMLKYSVAGVSKHGR